MNERGVFAGKRIVFIIVEMLGEKDTRRDETKEEAKLCSAHKVCMKVRVNSILKNWGISNKISPNISLKKSFRISCVFQYGSTVNNGAGTRVGPWI